MVTGLLWESVDMRLVLWGGAARWPRWAGADLQAPEFGLGPHGSVPRGSSETHGRADRSPVGGVGYAQRPHVTHDSFSLPFLMALRLCVSVDVC